VRFIPVIEPHGFLFIRGTSFYNARINSGFSAPDAWKRERNELRGVACFAERSWRDLSPSLPLAPGRAQQGKE
jgi:hypothetical protein